MIKDSGDLLDYKMNSKIEDLAEEAWGRIMETMPDECYIPIEKFAELIIHECLRQSDSVAFRNAVKKEFGMKVEEE